MTARNYTRRQNVKPTSPQVAPGVVGLRREMTEYRAVAVANNDDEARCVEHREAVHGADRGGGLMHHVVTANYGHTHTTKGEVSVAFRAMCRAWY